MPETAAERPTDRSGPPWEAAGLVVGPVAFVAAWVLGGALTAGHSPASDAISRLAGVGAPQRALMTGGFVAYGVGVVVGARALSTAGLGRCAPVLVANGLATLTVAATPLDRSGLVDGLHAVAATVGYVSIAVVPLLAAGPLRAHGHRRCAHASLVAGAISAACLAATTVSEANGLFQRVGLGAGDLWLAAAGVTLLATAPLRRSPPCPLARGSVVGHSGRSCALVPQHRPERWYRSR